MTRTELALVLVLLVSGVISARPAFSQELTYPFVESSLGGVVRSEAGEPLEGILIRAKMQGDYRAKAVATNAQGQYRFPKLEPGQYVVEVARADSLEPSRRTETIQNGREMQVDFILGPAKEMDQQITSTDWLLSLPGTPEQVRRISNECIHCHTGTLQRFRFDKENWLKIVRLMRGRRIHGAEWAAETHGVYPGAPLDREDPRWEEENSLIADYLARIRGPEPLALPNAKISPRPTGRSTRVLFTEYEIPYPDAELHDIEVDRYGMVWWTDWRWPYIGMLNPETGEMKYWESPPPPGKPEVHPGGQEISFDKDENPWTPYAWSGGLLKFDRNTEEFSSYILPDKNPRRFLSLGTDPVRNRIWFHTDDYYGTYYPGYFEPDKGNGKWTLYELPFKEGKRTGGIYGDVTDSKGNRYLMKHRDSDIDRIDVATEEHTRYPTPTPNAFPRRGDYDSRDRIWFAEYNAGKIGMLDPETGKITEYTIPLPMAMPYGTGVDRNTDDVWVELYRHDRLVRLDSETGEMLQYLLPERHVMARSPRPSPRSSAAHSIMWLGTLPKYGNGKLLKIETW